jgi:hypothetical protein
MDLTRIVFDASVRLGIAMDHLPGAPATVEEITSLMDEMGIYEALVWHADAQCYDVQAGNASLLNQVKHITRLHPAWVFLPHETDEVSHPEKVVHRMLCAGVKAARIFPIEHHFMVRLWNISGFLECLAAHTIPLFVDFGIKSWGDEVIDWDGIYEICTAYENLPVVLTSVNIGTDRRLIPMMKRLPNLYIETSYYTVHRGIEFLVTTVGAERVLFGTGLPLRAPGPALTALGYAMITDEEKRLIAGDNLRRLLLGVRTK